MSANVVPVGQEGLRIKVALIEDGLAVNLISASVKIIKLYKPSGGVVEKTASFLTDGSDGILYVSTVAGDLDEPGWYGVRAYVEQGTFNGHSSQGQFMVEAL
jgi:hypothetical protein